MSEWISVKDKLPEDDQTILMCELGQSGLPIIGWYETYDIPGFYMAHAFQEARVHVTHWMPIPENPVKDE